MKTLITTALAGTILASILPSPSSAEEISTCVHNKTGRMRILLSEKCKKSESIRIIGSVSQNDLATTDKKINDLQTDTNNIQQKIDSLNTSNSNGNLCANKVPASLPAPIDTLPSYISDINQAMISSVHEMPKDWSSLTPTGMAIGTGSIEIKSLDMWCDVDGTTRIIGVDLSQLEVGLYKIDYHHETDSYPFYGNQFTLGRSEITPQGTWKTYVEDGKITHWYIKPPRPILKNAKDCYVKSEMKISNGVFASISGDYYEGPTSSYSGHETANKFMGMSDWYHYNSDSIWQTLIMGKCYTPPNRIF
jgi:hypothetical protein